MRANILNMKKYIVKLLIGGVFALVFANGAHAYIERNMATVRIMNKAAGKTQTLTIPVGRAVEFEKLSMTVRSCKQTDPFQAENYFMFIEVAKSGDGDIFSGWMNKNEPGDNPLQDADYDLWLVGCVTGENK